MTFGSTKKGRNIRGKYVEYYYTFTAASGDTTGTIQTPLHEVKDITVSGELSDGSAVLAGLTARLNTTVGAVVIAFTNPAANAKGRLTVVGKE